ncbi:copper chaperone PCu(A)C [Aliiglaciecola litoralis]|uniref:Copper chaperone PCu(A)C n=1 Tax=Aliiglaciecola litoralis TaxID=582857 RepID=A0ABP3WTE3_9ALTE
MALKISTVNTIIISFVLVLAFYCQAASAQLQVSNATVRLLPPGVPNTSAYFTIENSGTQDQSIVAAELNFARKAELHAHIMDGDMMRMEQQQQVRIAAGESVTFKPGGLHVMIFGLAEPLQENQQVSFTLVTGDNQKIDVTATVVMPGNESSHHHQ